MSTGKILTILPNSNNSTAISTTVRVENADGNIVVNEAQYQDAVALSEQDDKLAALENTQPFGVSDFRDDIKKITVPTLVIHGDSDGIVPFDGSGTCTHEAIAGSELHIIAGGPHGINVSHADEFNQALLDFLAK